ncbi:unnamed protein product, partial [Phaeothamnion confervicola]
HPFSPPPQAGGSPEHYHPATFFLEALTQLAMDLAEVEPGGRIAAMRDGLGRLNDFFLSEASQGSEVIYVPFGGEFLQVRAIREDESMPFSTKERVPLLVCLEVQAVDLSALISRRGRARPRLSAGFGGGLGFGGGGAAGSGGAGGFASSGDLLDRIKDMKESLPRAFRSWTRQRSGSGEHLDDSGVEGSGRDGDGNRSAAAAAAAANALGLSELSPQKGMDFADVSDSSWQEQHRRAPGTASGGQGGGGRSGGSGGRDGCEDGIETSWPVAATATAAVAAVAAAATVSEEALGQWGPPSADANDDEPGKYLALLRQASESTSRALQSAVRMGESGA